MRQASWPIRRQRAEQRPALGDPSEAPLQHRDGEPTGAEIADGQGQQGPVRRDLRAQHRAGEARPQALVEQWLNQGRGQMQDDKRVASHRRRDRDDLEGLRIGADREMADLSASGRP